MSASTAPTVLVIEDDADMREVERIALDRDGYEVLLARNGLEGLERLAERRPCVIILDLMMPIMDGLTFLAERRKRGLAEGVPVVCVSAGGDEIVSRALRLGARECITKPADLDDVCDRVSYYCSGD